MRPTLLLAQQAAQAAKTTAPIRTFRELHGVVISAGLMDKTVKVRVGGQKWNAWIKKFFDTPKPTFKSKRHVVKHIIAPGSGVPISGRPAVPTAEELHAEREADREVKDRRRMLARVVKDAEGKIMEVEKIGRQVGKEVRLWEGLMGRKEAEGKGEGAKP
ncbi:hypothetical protein N0V88_006110 [Collariella sp. IMI 366227]|nr:hypothetical protein N0V88_006110 [Collariella sp. IMI 366227]